MLYQGKLVYNRILVFFISLIFGVMGIDRIYLKDYKWGLIKFATLGGLGVWYFLDIYYIGLGHKLGIGDYMWSCEISKKTNCKEENDLIFKSMLFFAIISLIIVIYYYPKQQNVLIRDDPYETINK
jgi:TM2 domain-containing membrane protein YozV